MKRKLIRDKIPQLIEAEGRSTSHIKQEFNDKLLKRYIAEKVLEEAQELYDAILSDDIEAMVEEAIDLQEVLHKVQVHFDMDVIDFMEKGIDKVMTKGAFNNNYVMEIQEDSSKVDADNVITIGNNRFKMGTDGLENIDE